ncbi:MAG: hypothetical protein CMF46_00320 [Legionellales bacterium]|nr:hypothetical protein [Legionellales bacterium]|tara:strand:- start:4658 stop:4930 length:273 start_codon:yes stop_codon:yes gene_type:complete
MKNLILSSLTIAAILLTGAFARGGASFQSDSTPQGGNDEAIVCPDGDTKIGEVTGSLGRIECQDSDETTYYYSQSIGRYERVDNLEEPTT